MRLPLFIPFSDGLFDLVKKDYGKIDDAKKRSDKEEIEYLRHVVAGYRGLETKRKKQLKGKL